MRLLSPISDKVTDNFILQNYNNAKFVSDYQPKLPCKRYVLKNGHIVDKFSAAHKWHNNHRVVNRFWKIKDKFVAPFGFYGVTIYNNGRTIILDGKRKIDYHPDIFIGRNKLSIKSAIQKNKNTIIFNYGIIQRELIITDFGLTENYWILSMPESFVKVRPNFVRRDFVGKPFFARDAAQRYLMLFTNGENKMIPLPVFDIVKFPVLLDDSYTFSSYSAGNKEISNDNSQPAYADLHWRDITDGSASNVGYSCSSTSTDTVYNYYAVDFTFPDHIAGKIIQATLNISGTIDDNSVDISDAFALTSGNFNTFISNIATTDSVSASIDVTQYVTGNNDNFEIKWKNVNNNTVIFSFDPTQISLYIEYVQLPGGFGSNV